MESSGKPRIPSKLTQVTRYHKPFKGRDPKYLVVNPTTPSVISDHRYFMARKSLQRINTLFSFSHRYKHTVATNFCYVPKKAHCRAQVTEYKPIAYIWNEPRKWTIDNCKKQESNDCKTPIGQIERTILMSNLTDNQNFTYSSIPKSTNASTIRRDYQNRLNSQTQNRIKWLSWTPHFKEEIVGITN